MSDKAERENARRFRFSYVCKINAVLDFLFKISVDSHFSLFKCVKCFSSRMIWECKLNDRYIVRCFYVAPLMLRKVLQVSIWNSIFHLTGSLNLECKFVTYFNLRSQKFWVRTDDVAIILLKPQLNNVLNWEAFSSESSKIWRDWGLYVITTEGRVTSFIICGFVRRDHVVESDWPNSGIGSNFQIHCMNYSKNTLAVCLLVYFLRKIYDMQTNYRLSSLASESFRTQP